MNADGTDMTQITFTEPPGFSGFPGWGKWAVELPQFGPVSRALAPDWRVP